MDLEAKGSSLSESYQLQAQPGQSGDSDTSHSHSKRNRFSEAQDWRFNQMKDVKPQLSKSIYNIFGRRPIGNTGHGSSKESTEQSTHSAKEVESNIQQNQQNNLPQSTWNKFQNEPDNSMKKFAAFNVKSDLATKKNEDKLDVQNLRQESGLGSKVAELIQSGMFNEGDMQDLIKNHFAKETKPNFPSQREEHTNQNSATNSRPVSLMSAGIDERPLEKPSYRELFNKLKTTSTEDTGRDAINVKKNGNMDSNQQGLITAKLSSGIPDKPFNVWQKMIQAPSTISPPIVDELSLNRPQSENHLNGILDGQLKTPKTSKGAMQEHEFPFRGPVEVDIRQFPFHALLRKDDLYVCGAIVVSNRWLLTAGQCVNTNDPWNLQVQ